VVFLANQYVDFVLMGKGMALVFLSFHYPVLILHTSWENYTMKNTLHNASSTGSTYELEKLYHEENTA